MYMKFLMYLLILSFISVSSWAQYSPWSARQGPMSLRDKSQNAYRDVWSLSDYFETQRKVRLMDQWLALNSSSNPFEFFVGGQTVSYESVTTTDGVEGSPKDYRMNRAEVGAYATIIGLEGEYIDSTEDFNSFEGSIHLRLLGRTVKGTNLTAFYGIRSIKDKSLNTTEEKFQQNFVGGSFTLNFTKFFGIIGTYKKYFEDKTDAGNTLDGNKYEGTFFIDFSFVRVYGTYFNEKENYEDVITPTSKEIERHGILGGLKIFF